MNFIYIFYDKISWKLALSPFLDISEKKIIMKNISSLSNEFIYPCCLRFLEKIQKNKTIFDLNYVKQNVIVIFNNYNLE